jgi:hypothetical protein
VVLEIAQENAAPSIRFGLIDAAALAAAKHWEGALERAVDWEWFAGYAAFKFRIPVRRPQELSLPGGLTMTSKVIDLQQERREKRNKADNKKE